MARVQHATVQSANDAGNRRQTVEASRLQLSLGMRQRAPWGAIALAMYGLALAAPCVETRKLFGGGTELDSGLACLLLGWMTIPWYANLFFVLAGIAGAFERYDVAIFFAVFAIATGLTLFLLDTRQVTPYFGCFAWLASMVFALIAACVGRSDQVAQLRHVDGDLIGDDPPEQRLE
ncbi:MAG: hypothetical protein ABI678_11540 [Kofleriaceae bacterium]